MAPETYRVMITLDAEYAEKLRGAHERAQRGLAEATIGRTISLDCL